LLTLPALTLTAGQALAIRGPSGAGKSTLLFAMAGLTLGTSGRISWGETDILALNAARRAAFRRLNIGLIFQDHQLFEELSALDNAAIMASFAPDRAAIRTRAAAALEALGITDLYRRAESFSGGERQRIAVARALAHDPAILLADEPTASLDRANADRLIADLMALVRRDGRSLIVVSHDPALHDAADAILDLADGCPQKAPQYV
jgi:ABC-type lipoprotein export system ATPase subunit